MLGSAKKTVLVAVLDWGLGHAGRSIPLIAALLQQGAEVIMAGSGRSGILLQKSFPELSFLECPPYRIHYHGRNFHSSIILQLPKIFYAAVREYRWLQRTIREHRIDAVISDSRFGCFSGMVPSVILTHQLNLVLSPTWLSRIVNFFYRQVLGRFDEIWVPDYPGGLSGKLSYPSPFKQTHYIGWLSRFGAPAGPIVRDVLVLLSGPEPQRSRLEKIIREQLQELTGFNVLLVQGKTDVEERYFLSEHLEVVSYLSGTELREAMSGAAVVLCRSGYSSLMELVMMRKKAILIPTPGQSEQEYLAERCTIKQWAVVVPVQSQLDIEKALALVYQTDQGYGFPLPGKADELQFVLERLLDRC